MTTFTPAAGNHTSTSLEFQPLELLPGDLLRPLGTFEEIFCLFDQRFPTNGALAAQIARHTTVQQWRYALDAVQQRHPLLSVDIDTTFNRVPHLRHVFWSLIRMLTRIISLSIIAALAVPLLAQTSRNSMDRYETLVHQASDTFDSVVRSDLDQTVAVTGSTAYAIADAPQPFAAHLSPAEVADMFRKCNAAADFNSAKVIGWVPSN